MRPEALVYKASRVGDEVEEKFRFKSCEKEREDVANSYTDDQTLDRFLRQTLERGVRLRTNHSASSDF